MKRIASLLLVAIFAGAITLGAYKLFVEKDTFKIVTAAPQSTTYNASYKGASSANPSEIDFTVAAQNTVNAVVHVKNATIKRNRLTISDLFYGQGNGNATPQIASGSGVIISPDGYIVTNNHVIAGADQLQITLNNNKIYDAELIGADKNTDIALLKIDADEKLTSLAFGDSDNTKIGEWVLAVGNPFDLTSTVTAGIVSAKARSLGGVQSFIQTDAAVNPGNSGGALVNTNGELIGINTAITSQTGTYVGYSFAVPSNIAKKIINDILEFGNVQKGILGIQSPPLNSPLATELGTNETDGVYISAIIEGSGADDADLRVGDIITKIDNITIHKMGDLRGYITAKRPGDKLNVTVLRDGNKKSVPVVLKKNNTAILPLFGLQVKNLTKKDKKNFDTDYGVKIIDTDKRYRELNNSILLKVNDEKVSTIEDATALLKDIYSNETYNITILNENGERHKIIFR